MKGVPELRILTDWSQFLAIEQDWRALHECVGGALFSSFDWLVATHAAFGLPGPMCFVTLWQDGKLAAAAAMVEVRVRISKLLPHYRPRVLAPYACKYSGFTEFLAVDDALYDRLCQAVVVAAKRRPLDIAMLREGEGRDRLLAVLAAKRRKVRESPAYESVVQPLSGTWDEYLHDRGRNFRKAHRKAMSRLEELGGRIVPATDFGPQILARILSVSERSWKGTAGTGVGGSPENARFLDTICTRLAPSDGVDISFLVVDGTDVAFCITLRHGQTQYGLWTEFDETVAELSPGRLGIANAINGLIEYGQVRDFDFVRRTHFTRDFGDQAYSISQVRAMPARSLSFVLTLSESAIRQLAGNRQFGHRKSVRRGDVV